MYIALKFFTGVTIILTALALGLDALNLDERTGTIAALSLTMLVCLFPFLLMAVDPFRSKTPRIIDLQAVREMNEQAFIEWTGVDIETGKEIFSVAYPDTQPVSLTYADTFKNKLLISYK